MKRFWDTVIEPILEVTRPESIVEIGSDEGLNTRNLLDFCERTNAVLHVVDPLPKYDVSEWQERYGARLVFHRSLSLNALPSIDQFDAVLVDGDHNWYTVYNELRLIEERCAELSLPFPLVMLHDVDWPYGRRDLYYDPDTVPEAYRRPYDSRGTRPGEEGLLDEGGLNQRLDKALQEGGPRNGVLTAVEDFLDETDQQLKLVRIPGFHGLAILVPLQLKQNEEFVAVLATWDLPPTVALHIERLEEAWLGAEIHRQEQQQRLKQQQQRLKQQQQRLEQQQQRLEQQRHKLQSRGNENPRANQTSSARRLPQDD